MDEKRFGLGMVLYVFNQDLSRILLLKLNEFKRVKFGADWGNVGGKIDVGETSLESCIRESKEEIGVKFEPRDLRLLSVKEIPNFFKKVHAVQFVYGTAMDERKPIILGRELESYQWFDVSNLPERTLDTREDYYCVRNLFFKKKDDN
jgi:8-oxo-dGTP pyrophosphatase MutT (NUDIX family)